MGFLTDTAIDASSLVAEVMRQSDGACVVFSGVVRNHHRGRSVVSIYYDAYRAMAEKELGKIVASIQTRFPDVAMTVQHRLGLLVVGEASIVIVTSSPHREEAYAASRLLIDRIKETVPIWKKERTSDGEEWIGWQHE